MDNVDFCHTLHEDEAMSFNPFPPAPPNPRHIPSPHTWVNCTTEQHQNFSSSLPSEGAPPDQIYILLARDIRELFYLTRTYIPAV